eukprot:scaffold92330_cov21-Tisochrysis_lutea.AAC.1
MQRERLWTSETEKRTSVALSQVVAWPRGSGHPFSPGLMPLTCGNCTCAWANSSYLLGQGIGRPKESTEGLAGLGIGTKCVCNLTAWQGLALAPCAYVACYIVSHEYTFVTIHHIMQEGLAGLTTA